MNGFERHGIGHLSASSINLWTNAPDVWVARYLCSAEFPFRPASERGKAVETAVVETLLGEDEAAAVKRAHEAFDRSFLIGDETTARERDLIAPMVAVAVQELAAFGRPEFPENGQEKVSITAACGDFDIPVFGFLDLVYPRHGLVVDLKTTTRIPASMSADHRLQRAIYAKAKRNMAVRFLYVSAKKAAWLEDGDVAWELAQAKAQIVRLERFLRTCDAETARAIVPVNPNSFYWRDAERVRSEIYGL